MKRCVLLDVHWVQMYSASCYSETVAAIHIHASPETTLQLFAPDNLQSVVSLLLFYRSCGSHIKQMNNNYFLVSLIIQIDDTK